MNRPESHLSRLLAPVKRGLSLMIYRAIARVISDEGKLQTWQVDALSDETLDGLERFGAYGLASKPHTGAEAIVVSVGGTRSHGVIIGVEDRRYRLTGLSDGEVALYDDLGQVVHLARNGLKVKSPLPVSIESDVSVAFKAPKITMDADEITATAGLFKTSGTTHLGGSDKAIARHDDAVVAGKVVATSTKVQAG